PWAPEPSVAGRVRPIAIAVWHPSPGIGRHPRVAEAGIPHPRSVHERVPTHASEVGLPYVAVTRHVHEVAVVIQIAYAVAIRIVTRRLAGSIPLLIVRLLTIPLVIRIFFDALGECVSVFVREIEGRAFLLAHFEGS